MNCIVALAEGVRWSPPYRGHVVLLSRQGAISRIDERAATLLPMLSRGTTVGELAAAARESSPASIGDMEANVRNFLAALDRQRFLDSSPSDAGRWPSQTVRYWRTVGNCIERSLRWTRLDNRRAGFGFVALSAALAACAVAVAPWHGALALLDVATRFRIEALLLVALCWLPIHELAHVAAAVGQGIAVRGFVIRLPSRGFVGFRIAVDVSEVLLCPSASRRFWVYFSGPVADVLLFASATLMFLYSNHDYMRDLSASLVWLGMFIVLANTSPSRRSDLAKAMANLVGDPLMLDLDKPGSRLAVLRRWHAAAFFSLVLLAAACQAAA